MSWESLFPIYVATMTIDGNVLPFHRAFQAGEFVTQPFRSKEGMDAIWEFMFYPQGHTGEEWVQMRAFLTIPASPSFVQDFPIIEGRLAQVLAGEVAWLSIETQKSQEGRPS